MAKLFVKVTLLQHIIYIECPASEDLYSVARFVHSFKSSVENFLNEGEGVLIRKVAC